VGTGILGGMLAATLVGVFFTPLFYVTMMNLFNRRRPPAKAAEKDATAVAAVEPNP
jgi:multidrug efflux pump